MEMLFGDLPANRALHKADYGVEILLREIIDVTNDFGFVTGIILLQTDCGAIKIRVYGAQGFDIRIRSQIAAVCIAPQCK